MVPCCKALYTIPGIRKHLNSSNCLDMLPIVHVQETLIQGKQLPLPVTVNIQQLCTAIGEGGVGQHSTCHHQQPDKLYVDEICWQSMGQMVITPTDWYWMILTYTHQSRGAERLKAFCSLLLDEMHRVVLIALNIRRNFKSVRKLVQSCRKWKEVY